MNTNSHRTSTGPVAASTGEQTLRLIAELPAPPGLEDRVHEALHRASKGDSLGNISGSRVDGGGRVLDWPTALKPQSNWMRTAAAAAIVFVVVGGGWGVYTRVGQNHPAKILAMPPRIAEPGGFAGAAAKRTPQTLPGPTLKQPVKPKDAKKPAAAHGKEPATGNAPAAAQ
jgi:hypothetical protein